MAKSETSGASRRVDRVILTATLAFSGGALVGLVALAFAIPDRHGAAPA